MPIALSVSFFLLGTVAGSFINALSFRFNTGRGMSGRSRCMHCGHRLSPLDLIPILSYIFLCGRCRYCKATISPQYPLVELAGGVLALGVWQVEHGPLSLTLSFLFWMTLLFLAVYDLRHTILPGSPLGFLFFLALLYVIPHPSFNAALGALLALPLYFFSFVSSGRWMGWADGTLELSLGMFVGLSLGLTGLLLAFWSGATVGIILLLAAKGYTMKSELPFAPFLMLGAGVAYFFHVDLFSHLVLSF